MLYPKCTRSRNLLSLDGVWDFAREVSACGQANGFVAEKKVAVPSSFNDLYTDEELRTWQSGVWYSRRFTVPRTSASERLVLRFNAVNYRAEVFLNGERLGDHDGGYTPFEFDITAQANLDGENLLCVRVENVLSNETVPMGNLNNSPEPGQFAGQYPDTPFDFFPYSGIHRPVTLYTTSQVGWLEKIAVSTSLNGDVCLSGEIGGAAAEIEIECEGKLIVSKVSDGTFENAIQVDNPRLWHVGKPNLYTAVVRLKDTDGRLLDEYPQRFGIREVRIEGDRVLLNGEPVYLQGFGRHEDFFLIGKGLNHSVNIRDHELLHWINANSYRTTHYPYSEELIQLADEQGVLIISEAPAVSINFDYVTEKTLQTHLKLMAELVERDRNYPSVIMWSVANEATTDREESVPYFAELANLVRSMDSTRPVTMVTCKAERDLVMEHFDVVGVNLYPGWYHLPGQLSEAKQDLRNTLEAMYAAFGKPILITEFGADTIAGMHALPAEQWSEEYQLDLVEGLIEVMRSLDFVVGEHLWNFADFRTAQNFARVGGNKKGIFTRDRQPKMVAHLLRKIWSQPRYADT